MFDNDGLSEALSPIEMTTSNSTEYRVEPQTSIYKSVSGTDTDFYRGYRRASIPMTK